MRVLISGSTGLVGTALVAALPDHGHEPVRLVRRNRPDDHPCVGWDPAAGTLPANALDGIDVVVHLAGEGIAERRWTSAQKTRLIDSRVASTTLLADAIAAAQDPPRVFLSGSAIGHYGSRQDEVLTESDSQGTGFLSDLVARWEGATAAVTDARTRVVHLRTGMVLSERGGALRQLLPFFRLGIGGKIGNGRQWMSWIAIGDMVGALIWLLDHDLYGPVNLTAPNPVTNNEFTETLGAVLHRPTLLPTPKPALWAKLGRELTDELLYVSQRVLPTALTASGYEFRHPELEPALRILLDRPG